MCIINKYANIYLQKVYIVMSCLCDFLNSLCGQFGSDGY